MGAVLCIITKSDLPAAPSVFTLKRPAAAVILVNKPRLPISSLDIIIKLKLR